MNENVGRIAPILRSSLMYIAGLLLVLVLDRVGVLYMPRNLLERGLAYVYGGVENVLQVAVKPVEWIRYANEGSKRVASLEERLSKAAVETTELEELRQENQALKQVKGIISEEAGKERVMARLLQLDQGLGIDRGEVDGVMEGMVVEDSQGVLLGAVVQTSGHRGVLMTPTDREAKIPVRVVGEKTLGVLVGDGVRAVLTEVLQADELNPGDILVTTGQDGKYPEGLVVAQVLELTGGVSDTTKGAKVELLAEDEEFAWVRKE